MSTKKRLKHELIDMKETALEGKINFSNFKCAILFLFLNDYEIIFSFLCGVISNIPISVLFNILTLNKIDFHNCWCIAYFSIYAVCFCVSVVLTAVSFLFVHKYLMISKSQNEKPSRIMKCLGISNRNDNLPQKMPLNILYGRAIAVMVLFGITAACFIALFCINLFYL